MITSQRKEKGMPADRIETPGANLQADPNQPVRDTPAGTQSAACGQNTGKCGHKLRVLAVEDDPADLELVLNALGDGGFDPGADAVQTAEEFTDYVRRNHYDVILADYSLPSWNGMATLEILRREKLDIPVIVVSGFLGELKAVECIKEGAADCVLKDHLPRLPESVRRAIREKKLRDGNRQAQEELARSNRDLEQFAYVASHDLQEPLRMVAIYTQLLAERYQGKLDQNADKYIHYVVDGALRMQTLVQDLLAFSRVGRQEVEYRTIDGRAVVETALQNLRAAIQDSGARIECAQLPTLVADSSQLAQLFQNLIGNAIKFHGAEPPLIRITAEKKDKDKDWLFSVVDNGIGIAPEHAEVVFAIFKRLHTRAEYPGSGIGLAICKKIVEQHGGRIWVESQPGRGAAFRFTLPTQEGRAIL
jgi:signal transduction histidine kinase